MPSKISRLLPVLQDTTRNDIVNLVRWHGISISQTTKRECEKIDRMPITQSSAPPPDLRAHRVYYHGFAYPHYTHLARSTERRNPTTLIETLSPSRIIELPHNKHRHARRKRRCV